MMNKIDMLPACSEFTFQLGEQFLKVIEQRTSLVAQWLRIHLPMQGTRIQSLVWEDPT